MKNYTIIEVSGNKDHGKDTLSDYLVEKHGFEKFSFGDSVKKVCSEILSENLETFNQNKNEMSWLGLTRRDLMTFIGTDVMRELLPNKYPDVKNKINDTIWVRKLQQKLIRLILSTVDNNPIKIVISDERMITENKLMKSFHDIIKGSMTLKEDLLEEQKILTEMMKLEIRQIFKTDYLTKFGEEAILKNKISSLINHKRFNVRVFDKRKPTPNLIDGNSNWHSSETEFYSFDFDNHFDNSYDKKTLYENIDNFIKIKNI